MFFSLVNESAYCGLYKYLFWSVEMTAVKKSVVTAVSIALCVVLPMAFHAVPNAGSIYLPMHLPVLVCGLVCGWPFGLLCGLAGPLVSSMLTGMPPAAFLPMMMIELSVYGLMIGLLSRFIRTGVFLVDVYAALIPAMLIGRVVAGLARAFVFAPGKITMTIWFSGYFVTALPGIVIQLVLIPAIVLSLMRAGLVPSRSRSARNA